MSAIFYPSVPAIRMQSSGSGDQFTELLPASSPSGSESIYLDLPVVTTSQLLYGPEPDQEDNLDNMGAITTLENLGAVTTLENIGAMTTGTGQMAEVIVNGQIHLVELQNVDTVVSDSAYSEECKFIQIHDLNKLPPPVNEGNEIENNNNFITLWHVNTDLELEQNNGPTTYKLEKVDMDADIKQQDLPATINFGDFNLEENVIHPKALHKKPLTEEHQILKSKNVVSRFSKNGRTGANRFDDEEKRELYKRTACDRERNRMKDMNKSFEQLKKRVPLARRGGKRTSKIRLLHLAIKYIKHLKFLLSFPVGQTIPPQIVQFDPSVEAWTKLNKTTIGGFQERNEDDIGAEISWDFI